jgi:predicted phosphohydrolase
MSIFALSDLHLSFGTNKPMDVFGDNWLGYEDKVRDNWNAVVTDDDYVLVCGDISWATYLKDAVADFKFIDSLNGKKLISKGNHDYWWCGIKKQNEFLASNGFNTIKFIHNNSYVIEDTSPQAEGEDVKIAICGSRGWLSEIACKTDEDKKIYNRELVRLDLSASSIKGDGYALKVAMLHYPPDEQFMSVMQKHNINVCVYGHIHQNFNARVEGNVLGVNYFLTSADYLQFKPLLISKGEL